MSDNQDLMKLYSQRILKLAANIPLIDRLENPDATVRKRSPLCGSTVEVDVNVENDVITAYGQDVKACALGQTAASVLGAHAIGASKDQLEKARDQLFAMLKSDGPIPDAPFDDLEVLLPAKEYSNRHASIMLALEATLQAMEEA
ncbi:iron-sulfur cluster assembly scaffold protein [Amylibacter sp. SFDW26]|uniref:iron-sulfur cluster assembly scaffold protein n=1 Tax=Amylibacter sp. SFDW26 TaxID=2652722 RepID=UPI0012621714|nr:iron-sulfur cluster assembly scaffold protein [Amylibacter sp. SFDW26]KAB7615901.1 iron-sulfur cluster assembly scaffold protein [Amylibacter sp. SFDW26]